MVALALKLLLENAKQTSGRKIIIQKGGEYSCVDMFVEGPAGPGRVTETDPWGRLRRGKAVIVI